MVAHLLLRRLVELDFGFWQWRVRFCADRMQSGGGGLKFPKLNVDTSDVAGAWREFLDSFRLAGEFATESWELESLVEIRSIDLLTA